MSNLPHGYQRDLYEEDQREADEQYAIDMGRPTRIDEDYLCDRAAELADAAKPYPADGHVHIWQCAEPGEDVVRCGCGETKRF